MREKAEARRERKPREEVGLGAWIQPYHLLGPLQTYPSPPSAPHCEGREDGGIVFLHAPLPWLRSDNRLGLLQRTPGHWVGVGGRGSAEQPLSN